MPARWQSPRRNVTLEIVLVDLAFPGARALAVHARIGDFDRITFRATVVLPPQASALAR